MRAGDQPPRPLLYEAPGFGVGEVWLDAGGRVFHSELPRPKRTGPSAAAGQCPRWTGPSAAAGHGLIRRLAAFFAGAADDFADVEVVAGDGFYGECVRVLRALPRGEVVTYGELAALAGRPGAARAAGTFCGRCDLSPFVPTHRVVSAGGIGSYGDLGVEYKRRLLELEGVHL
ncbi:MAG TPA: MGMT family protein [Gaiellaceae bacterium]|jgi:methylated-DNA-[protein]-cysteine S-methyltransferase